jgi:hypothetical protein
MLEYKIMLALLRRLELKMIKLAPLGKLEHQILKESTLKTLL